MSVSQAEDKAPPQADGQMPPNSVEELKLRLETLNEDVTSFIKQHAGLCLLGAVAVGYIVARVARKGS
jgi:hypothetical protein